MGSADADSRADDDERPRHEVELGPFLIAKFELSQAEWQRIMAHNPSRFRGEQLPLETVSWRGCRKYCQSAKPRLMLPTEAQWEYACRAGSVGVFAVGEELEGEQANFRAPGAARRTRPIDSYSPNSFGLHNIHGNVSEWCRDVYDASFYSRDDAKGRDPVCGSGSEGRVLRGGGWNSPASACRSGARFAAAPTFRHPGLGFRPVFELED